MPGLARLFGELGSIRSSVHSKRLGQRLSIRTGSTTSIPGIRGEAMSGAPMKRSQSTMGTWRGGKKNKQEKRSVDAAGVNNLSPFAAEYTAAAAASGLDVPVKRPTTRGEALAMGMSCLRVAIDLNEHALRLVQSSRHLKDQSDLLAILQVIQTNALMTFY
ncbi:unnamed protein product [Protopolystoma xenopodis]|uniref:Uncharacterized protein n=1 Tax=Protopolystoma xenopodis TaxID=117903 RepID=A0A3S5AJQ6_9PLAT|nr:unnamed protein product [Protopolystoma xenopodis]